MCVIILRPSKKTPPKDVLESNFNRNNHSWGLMYADKGELYSKKGLGDFKQFYEAYKEVPLEADCAIHFRIMTSGLKDLDNCHPFDLFNKAENGIAVKLMHNGIIPIKRGIDQNKSDTWHFTHMLKGFLNDEPEIVFHADMQYLIEQETEYSKLLFMDNKGKIAMTNEKDWVKAHGCMFSNSNALYGQAWKGQHKKHHNSNSFSSIDPLPKEHYDRNWQSTREEELEREWEKTLEREADNNFDVLPPERKTEAEKVTNLIEHKEKKENEKSTIIIPEVCPYKKASDLEGLSITELYNVVVAHPSAITDILMEFLK